MSCKGLVDACRWCGCSVDDCCYLGHKQAYCLLAAGPCYVAHHGPQTGASHACGCFELRTVQFTASCALCMLGCGAMLEGWQIIHAPHLPPTNPPPPPPPPHTHLPHSALRVPAGWRELYGAQQPVSYVPGSTHPGGRAGHHACCLQHWWVTRKRRHWRIHSPWLWDSWTKVAISSGGCQA
jgi:hypothetical protein